MKVERYENETDTEWAERLAYETMIANDTETTQYFVKDDPYQEDGFIINYVGKDSRTWKEHPEGSFTCKQILDWKKKAEPHPVTRDALLLEMERIILTESGIHMTHPLQEVFYSIVRDAWTAAEEADN